MAEPKRATRSDKPSFGPVERPTATILDSSPRAAAWRKIFGGGTVPIIGFLPMRASLPGKPDVEVYQLDLSKLSTEQLNRLAEHLSETFKVPREELEREILLAGVPILAEDVAVGVPLRFFT